jgi:hypothetical protein
MRLEYSGKMREIDLLDAKSSVGISLWGKCLLDHDPNGDWPLVSLIREKGVSILPLNDPGVTHYVAMDHSVSHLKAISKRIPVERRLLIALEPKAIIPSQYSRRVAREYKSVFVNSPIQALSLDNAKLMTLGSLPSLSEVNKAILENLRSTREPGSLGIINENKYSFVKGNLYKTRRSLVELIANSGIRVDLAGSGWQEGVVPTLRKQFLAFASATMQRAHVDLSNFQSPLASNPNLALHGRVPSAVEFLRDFEFALVVENDPDYISEKLFNAILAGCVPLYVGPPLAVFSLPADLAVPISANSRNISDVVRALTQPDKDRIREVGTEWLEERAGDGVWSNYNHLEGISKAIASFLSNQDTGSK